MQAIVLAGGKGTRLQSVVSDVPKPLASIDGRPFLVHLLEYLAKNSITRVVLSTCYLSEKIEEFFGSTFSGMQIAYAAEETPLGTGGAIEFASRQITEKRFFVLNGDTFFPLSLQRMAALHEQERASLTLALKEVSDTCRYGRVSTLGTRIKRFEEKGITGPGLINGGIYLMESSLVEDFPSKRPLSFETDILSTLPLKSPVAAFVSDAYFIDLGIPEDYARAQKEIGQCPTL
jgi:D-glycero-alpha-D-manno-heptose 1-phosphate guanylyltransferase